MATEPYAAGAIARAAYLSRMNALASFGRGFSDQLKAGWPTPHDTQETTMTDPAPLTLENLIADLRTADADEARASQATNATYDLVLGVIAALERAGAKLAHGPHDAGSAFYAQGMVDALVLVLRGHTGTLPEAES